MGLFLVPSSLIKFPFTCLFCFAITLVGLKRDQAFKFSMANPDRGDHANQSWGAPAIAKRDW